MTVVDPIADLLTRIRNALAARKEPVLTGLQRVSKPGRRVYTKRENIPLVLSGMGVAILSTSRGVMTGKRAHRLRLGGEVLCHIW
jgi:small subunit ribosomal protein S8